MRVRALKQLLLSPPLKGVPKVIPAGLVFDMPEDVLKVSLEAGDVEPAPEKVPDPVVPASDGNDDSAATGTDGGTQDDGGESQDPADLGVPPEEPVDDGPKGRKRR